MSLLLVLLSAFASLGGTITSQRTVASTAELTATLTAIQAEGPNVIFYSDNDADNAGLLSRIVGTYQGFDGQGDVIPQWAWLERYADGQWAILHPDKVFLPIMRK